MVMALAPLKAMVRAAPAELETVSEDPVGTSTVNDVVPPKAWSHNRLPAESTRTTQYSEPSYAGLVLLPPIGDLE